MTADDDDREARLAKAMAEALYVRTFLGPNVGEAILAAEIEELRKRIAGVDKLKREVNRLNNVQSRVHTMIAQWRRVAQEQREAAVWWRERAEITQADSLSWHALRLEARAQILEVNALLLESLLTTR